MTYIGPILKNFIDEKKSSFMSNPQNSIIHPTQVEGYGSVYDRLSGYSITDQKMP